VTTTFTTTARVALAAALLALWALPPALDADQTTTAESPAAPAGLETFLEARLLESQGRYREALEAYAAALKEAPDSLEVRVTYAALLSDLGLPERAVSLLAGRDDLDWYGLRTRALALAQIAIQKPDQLPEAADALRGALAERDDDPQVQLAYAQILERQGKIAEAETMVAQMRRGRSSHPQLAAYDGSLLQRLGRFREAADAYRVCADQGPQAGSCRQGLVDSLVALGRSAEAGEAMLGWLADDDLDGLLRAASLLSDGGRTDVALRTVRRVLAVQPDSVRARTLEALLLSAMGRSQEAVSRLEALKKKAPEDVNILLPLAWAEARLGQLDAARATLDHAWELAKDDSTDRASTRTALTAARIELATDHPLVAREWLERLADPDSGGPELVQLLALTYRRTEQWRQGVAGMLRLQPRLTGPARLQATAFEAECRLRLGEAKGMERLRPLLGSANLDAVFAALGVLQGLERWGDIERETASLLERFPDNRQLLFARAAALERLGRSDEAATTFQALLERNPDDAEAANYLGYMWADLGVHLDEALTLIRHAVELAPDNPAYIDSLGWVYFRLGHLDEAERWLRRAVADSPGDGTVLAHLGEVLAAQGKTGEARQTLQHALTQSPEHPDHVRALLTGLPDAPK